MSALPLRFDPAYARTLVRHFTILTPEDALKFGVLSPSPGAYDFSDADAIVDFAEKNDMEVRGHALIWHAQLPRWLLERPPARASLIDILTGHVHAVVSRYKGRIAAWDVVNEAVDSAGSLRNDFWAATLGAEYLDLAFRAARAADPAARLYYNDYGIEAGEAHTEGVCRLIRDLVRRDVPVDGVGLQMHLTIEDEGRTARIGGALARLSQIPVRVAVTECDVRMSVRGHPTEQQLASQARVYREVARACVETPACDALVLWGFTDRHSWVPHFFPSEGAALVFDEEYREKPAYWALADELSGARAEG